LYWPFDDPAKFIGSWEHKIEETRKISDEMKEKNSGYYVQN